MLASVIREVIAPVLRECPRKCGIVAITHLDVTEDLSFATAYISSLTEPEKAVEFLQDQRKPLQNKLAHALQLRRVPVLRFKLDVDLQKATRIDELLGEVSKRTPQDGK